MRCSALRYRADGSYPFYWIGEQTVSYQPGGLVEPPRKLGD